MAAITADKIIQLLDLEPLPIEGGYYAETYRSKHVFPSDEGVVRHLSSAIYYLLTPDTFSALHRLPGPEIYHFYCGDPVDLALFHADGRVETVVLGTDLGSGMRPQVVVPGGTWQGARVRDDGSYALLGATMSPGYHPDDFELGDRQALASLYPGASDLIGRLTR